MKRRGLKAVWLLGGIALAGCEEDPALGPTADGGGAVIAGPDAAGGSAGGFDASAGTPGAGPGSPEAGGSSPVPGSDAGAVPGLDAAGAAPDAAAPAPDAAGGEGGPGSGPTVSPFPPVSDFARPGPFTTTIQMNVGPSSNYAVYMPEGAPPAGAQFPLVGWVSGGATTHDWYELLPHLASHGFVVVTSNSIPGIGAEADLGREMMAGIDWALAENARQGAPLFGKLAATKIAASGYSMGSLATFTIANDPRLVTTVHISGGNMAPEPIRNLRAPAAFICGTPDPNCTPLDILSETCDIAAANCDLDFMAATTPVFYANFPGGHLGVMTSPHMERINGMMTAWLRRYLMDDAALSALFDGPDCTYCKDSNWKVQQKNL